MGSTEPVLLPYQQRWVLDRSPVKVSVKSRRIGVTWATAYEAVEVAASAGGSNFWYQTYAEDDAKEFIIDVANFARALDMALSVEEDETRNHLVLEKGEQSIKITSVKFASGFRVTALPHSPRKLRGKGGVYCLDEAAFHEDLPGALKAASAFRMWGGRIMFISTHDGIDNPFNSLVEDIKGGRFNYSLHQTTLVDAVREGLYKRVCRVGGIEWSEEREEEYVVELMETEGADEEFMCIPSRSGGQYIATPLVEACMTADYPVIRWKAEDDFLFDPDRAETTDAWCEQNLKPLLDKLDRSKPHYLGEDFGRSSDLTVFAPGFEAQDLKLHVPFIVELGNIPYEQQEQVFFYIAKRLPRMRFVALDGTGNGAALGEVALGYFGEEQAESVKMNDPWYAANLPPLKARFEDLAIVIPRDLDIRRDLSQFEVIHGVPKLPKRKVAAIRVGGGKEKRHGDAGIALACLNYAAKRPGFSYQGYKATGKRAGDFAGKGLIV